MQIRILSQNSILWHSVAWFVCQRYLSCNSHDEGLSDTTRESVTESFYHCSWSDDQWCWLILPTPFRNVGLVKCQCSKPDKYGKRCAWTMTWSKWNKAQQNRVHISWDILYKCTEMLSYPLFCLSNAIGTSCHRQLQQSWCFITALSAD